MSISCNLILLIFYCAMQPSHEHGRLMEPPARNTMWRFGFSTPHNYEDSELFCGGLKVQWLVNGGKCGVCGDAFNGKRIHETGGAMAKNITVRSYAPGSIIDTVIDIVANHAGAFTFQMCWRNSFDVKETESCFEPLHLHNSSKKYYPAQKKRGLFVVPVQLPIGKSCSHCVFRWNWKSANNWGICENGTEAIGCGPQETYRNCADIAVQHGSGIRGPLNHNGID